MLDSLVGAVRTPHDGAVRRGARAGPRGRCPCAPWRGEPQPSPVAEGELERIRLEREVGHGPAAMITSLSKSPATRIPRMRVGHIVLLYGEDGCAFNP